MKNEMVVRYLISEINRLVREDFVADRERLKKEYIQEGYYKEYECYSDYEDEHFDKILYNVFNNDPVVDPEWMFKTKEHREFIQKVELEVEKLKKDLT